MHNAIPVCIVFHSTQFNTVLKILFLDPKAFEDEGTTSLKYQEALTRDTVSHPRGPDSSATLLWKPDLERTFD